MTRSQQYIALATFSIQLQQAARMNHDRCRPCPYCGEPAPAIGEIWQCRNDLCPVQGSFSHPEELES